MNLKEGVNLLSPKLVKRHPVAYAIGFIIAVATALNISYIAIFGIDLYQKYYSPIKGWNCSYGMLHKEMTCSQFGKVAIKEHGLATGVAMLLKRFHDCREAHAELARWNIEATQVVLASSGPCDAPCESLGYSIGSGMWKLLLIGIGLFFLYIGFGKGNSDSNTGKQNQIIGHTDEFVCPRCGNNNLLIRGLIFNGHKMKELYCQSCNWVSPEKMRL